MNVKVCTMVLMVLIASCAQKMEVHIDSDPNHDFTGYKTFGWASIPPGVVEGQYRISELTRRHVEGQIKIQFQNKGYRFVENAKQADFAVNYAIGARDKLHVNMVPTFYQDTYANWGWGYSYYPTMGVAPHYSSGEVRSYTTVDGALSLDIFDVKTRRPIWYGEAREELFEKDIRENSGELVTEAVAKVIEAFPAAQ